MQDFSCTKLETKQPYVTFIYKGFEAIPFSRSKVMTILVNQCALVSHHTQPCSRHGNAPLHYALLSSRHEKLPSHHPSSASCMASSSCSPACQKHKSFSYFDLKKSKTYFEDSKAYIYPFLLDFSTSLHKATTTHDTTTFTSPQPRHYLHPPSLPLITSYFYIFLL